MVTLNKKIVALLSLFAFGLLSKDLYAFHSASRYFPFIENDYANPLSKNNKAQLNVDLIFSSASSAFRKGGSSAGIPELFGEYDLKDVIKSLQAVKGAAVDPIATVAPRSAHLRTPDRSMPFSVSEKISAQSIALSYIHWFADKTWFVGGWVPVMQVSGTSNYGFKSDKFTFPAAFSSKDKKEMGRVIDKIRRETHEQIGFNRNDWSDSGFGDIDLYAGYHFFMDHQLLMRSIDLLPKIGVIIPSGRQRNVNNPSAVPFMGNNHLGLYFEMNSLFELKQNLRVGLMFGGLYQLSKTKKSRIATFKEPSIYSSLVGNLTVNPGTTALIAPYLVLENLAEGLNLQAKYTYIRHAADKVEDARKDKRISSYLTMKPGAFSKENIAENITEKRGQTKWRSHYITLQLMYNSQHALANWKMKPNVYINYDIPFDGNGISQMHQVTAGIALHF